MKTLYLMRHAKSDWSEPSQIDFDRSLNTRGKKDASKMCSIVQDLKDVPKHFFISTAKRARKTIEPIYSTLTPKITYSDRLYSFNGSDYIEFIKEVPQVYESILILGHNPSIEYVAAYLLNTESANIRVPTGSLLKIEIESDTWKELEAGIGILHFFIHPKIVGLAI